MRCEVVAVGTELLLGQIVDTNSSWIGEHLAMAGINSHFQTKVGDNPERIESALRLALDRSDAVVVCGGLGPTQDDITRDIIAKVMGVQLELDDAIAEKIMAMFGNRGREMPANNFRQAEVPAGATPMAQQPGTAPGLVCPVGDKVIYAVPGVPYEMKQMVEGTVIPDLMARAGESAVIGSRTLRTWGQSESGLAEMLAGRITDLDAAGNPTIAFLASGIEGLKVRITAKADTQEQLDRILAAEEEQIRGIIGHLVFGIDDETMESVVLDALRASGRTLALAESVTGGLMAARLTAIPGASDVFRGSLVAYASELKFELLSVDEGPVITEAAAVQMAEGAARVLGADVGIGITGVAGPAEAEGQKVGTVHYAISIDGETIPGLMQMPFGRNQIREFSVISILGELRRRLVAS